MVRAFNSTVRATCSRLQHEYWQKPKRCSFVDDAGAKQVVSGLAEEIGFEAVDAGALDLGANLEPLRLWIAGVRSGVGANIVFKLLKR